jgi:glycosyltransferase involved in cell wall biosynthesis
MQQGMRPRSSVPLIYKDYYILRTHGRVYGIPSSLDPGEVPWPETLHTYPALLTVQVHRGLLTHPAVLQAATFPELESLIDLRQNAPVYQRHAGSFEGHVLIEHRGSWYGVPEQTGSVDLDQAEEVEQAGVVRGQTLEEVRQCIRRAREAVPIEFTGWLPVVRLMGNCGLHPQFKHTGTPPVGYRFTRSMPPKAAVLPSTFQRFQEWLGQVVLGLVLMIRPLFAIFQRWPRVSLRARLRLLMAGARLAWRMRRAGAKWWPVLCYLRSRSYASQMLLAEKQGLLFLASAPYTWNQNPWLIEIEDPTSLFYPFIQNGLTYDMDVKASPYYPIIKAQLEDHRCKGIVTHMRSTARMLPRLFQSDIIARKVFYTPLGVKLPNRWQRQEDAEPEHINLLFINSWCRIPTNLHCRGGLELIEAFAILHQRYPQVRLTVRSDLPELDGHYHRILESGWVRIINRFLSADEMEALLAESHIFLLPAARIHVVSLLQAMAAGLAVVTSDGWGIQEYVTHERNGMIVTGRYGRTSWEDEETGWLREDYQPTHTAAPEIVQGIVDAVSRLIEEPELRRRLGQTARHDVASTYNLTNWNHGLKQALDQGLGIEAADEDREPLPEPSAALRS